MRSRASKVSWGVAGRVVAKVRIRARVRVRIRVRVRVRACLDGIHLPEVPCLVGRVQDWFSQTSTGIGWLGLGLGWLGLGLVECNRFTRMRLYGSG